MLGANLSIAQHIPYKPEKEDKPTTVNGLKTIDEATMDRKQVIVIEVIKKNEYYNVNSGLDLFLNCCLSKT